MHCKAKKKRVVVATPSLLSPKRRVKSKESSYQQRQGFTWPHGKANMFWVPTTLQLGCCGFNKPFVACLYLEIYLCMNSTPSGQARNNSTLLVTRGAYVLPFPFWKCHQNCHLGRSLYHLLYHHVVTSGAPNIFSFSTYITAVTPFTAFIEEPHQFESTQCASTQPQKREASQKFEVCHNYGPKRDSKGMTRNIYQTTRHKADKMVKVLFTLCQYTIPLLFHVLKLYWPAVQDLLLPSLCPQAPSCWNICQCFLVYV